MTPSQHHSTAEADRIPVSQKIAYGMGAVVTIVAVNSVTQLTSLVYVVGLGMTLNAVPHLYDAVNAYNDDLPQAGTR